MGKYIMVVDDERKIAENLAEYLEIFGYETEIHSTVSGARDSYKQNKPDGIVSDNDVGTEYGSEFLAEVAPDYSTVNGNKPLVLITGRPDQEMKDEMERIGVKYIKKPFTMKDVLEFLNEQLE